MIRAKLTERERELNHARHWHCGASFSRRRSLATPTLPLSPPTSTITGAQIDFESTRDSIVCLSGLLSFPTNCVSYFWPSIYVPVCLLSSPRAENACLSPLGRHKSCRALSAPQTRSCLAQIFAEFRDKICSKKRTNISCFVVISYYHVMTVY